MLVIDKDPVSSSRVVSQYDASQRQSNRVRNRQIFLDTSSLSRRILAIVHGFVAKKLPYTLDGEY